MGKPGPKPAPASLKIANGTFRPDRDRQSAATGQVLTAIPKPPAKLGRIGKTKWLETWSQLDKSKLMESRFVDAVEMYCRAWDRLAHYELAHKGKEFQVTDSGYVCAHPAIGLAKQARDEIRRYQTEFGFTPSSANGVGNKQTPQGKSGVPSRRRDLA